MKHSPLVMCLESVSVDAVMESRGFIPIDDLGWLRALPAWFVPREQAEERPEFRQLIPYILLVADNSIVVYRRGSAGGEARLHQRLSLGLGGHIEIPDAALTGASIDLERTLELTAARELREEVGELPVVDRRWVGVLLSDADPVCRVHLGIVQMVLLAPGAVSGQEAAIRDCRFEPISDLPLIHDRLEGWSQLCADWLRRNSGQRQ